MWQRSPHGLTSAAVDGVVNGVTTGICVRPCLSATFFHALGDLAINKLLVQGNQIRKVAGRKQGSAEKWDAIQHSISIRLATRL